MLELNKTIIGKKIKTKRKSKKLTQFELAEKVGLHEKQISRIESGLNYPTYVSFAKIINALDMDINDFIENSEVKTNPKQDEIFYILNSAKEDELKIYLDILKPLKKNLEKKLHK